MAELEKIYCMDKPSDNSCAWQMATMFNNNNWNNNPFMYLIWLALFGNGNFFGNRYGQGEIQNAEVLSKLDSLERQSQDNHNNQLAMDALKGNHAAIHELADNLNIDSGRLIEAIGKVQHGISEVQMATGMTGERVISQIAQGNMNLVQNIKDCCCQTQQNILKMGYEGQIRDMQNTNALQNTITCGTNTLGNQLTQGFYNLQDSINRVNTGMERGFSAVAYESQKQTCDVINANNMNTQRIIDTMQNHWQAQTSQALQDAKFEISQLKQNQYIVDKLQA